MSFDDDKIVIKAKTMPKGQHAKRFNVLIIDTSRFCCFGQGCEIDPECDFGI